MIQKKDLTTRQSNGALFDELLSHPERLRVVIQLYAQINTEDVSEKLLDYLDMYYIFSDKQLQALTLMLVPYILEDEGAKKV